MKKYISIFILCFIGLYSADEELIITNLDTYVKGNKTILGTVSEDVSNAVATVSNVETDFVSNMVAAIAAGRISFTIASADYPDGFYDLFLEYQGTNATNCQTSNYSFFIINGAPFIACTNFVYLETNSGTNYYSGYASNLYPGIDPPAFYYKTNNGSLVEIGVTNLCWRININSHTLHDGTNTYTFYAVTSNYITNSVIYTNIINNVATTITVTNTPSVYSLKAYTFRGALPDTWPAVSVVRVIITNVFGTVKSNYPGTFTNYSGWYSTVNFTSLPAGIYKIYALATNVLGEGAVSSVRTFTNGIDVPSTVLIGDYPFLMGSSRMPNELPQHAVYISAFNMGVTEVTYKQWMDVIEWATNNGYSFDNNGLMGGDRLWSILDHTNTEPVTTISFYDAIKYCNALSEIQGLTPCYYTNSISASTVLRTTCPSNLSNRLVLFTNTASTTNGWRLPTEAEWEFAYYGLANSVFFWGNGDGRNYAWFRDNSLLKTKPVQTKLSNAFAIFDMAGNVAEWVWDWYDSYTNTVVKDPRGPAQAKTYRVIRGGSFKDTQSGLTGTKRGFMLEADARYYLGFRVCKTQ